MQYFVTASSLRLRKGASLSDPVLATLPNGHLVNVLDSGAAEWWKISAVLNGTAYEGYSAARYLKPQAAAATPPATAPAYAVKQVHYPTNSSSNRQSVNLRHAPLSEPDLPRRNISPGNAAAAKTEAIYSIVNYLDVENSRRYLPANNSTYCNIYAYDFFYCAQAYLPRVWWTSKTLMQFAQDPAFDPTPAYGKNVSELTANALYDWLDEWGDDFGWQRSYDVNALQSLINATGGVGVICAKRKDRSRSGHITCILPEAGGYSATRSGGQVSVPLQSQAGSKNKKLFASDWYLRLADQFSEVGFWYHD